MLVSESRVKETRKYDPSETGLRIAKWRARQELSNSPATLVNSRRRRSSQSKRWGRRQLTILNQGFRARHQRLQPASPRWRARDACCYSGDGGPATRAEVNHANSVQ